MTTMDVQVQFPLYGENFELNIDTKSQFSPYYDDKPIFFVSSKKKNDCDKILLNCVENSSVDIYNCLYKTNYEEVPWLHLHIVLNYLTKTAIVLTSIINNINKKEKYYLVELDMMMESIPIIEGEFLINLANCCFVKNLIKSYGNNIV